MPDDKIKVTITEPTETPPMGFVGPVTNVDTTVVGGIAPVRVEGVPETTEEDDSGRL